MSAIEALAEDWRRSCWTDAWHGSSLGALLRGLDAAAAAARPLPDGHSIVEIVRHLTGWTDEVGRRLDGHAPAMPADGDWPPADEPSAEHWQAALDALAETQGRFEAKLVAFPEARLGERVGGDRDAPLGTGISYGAMISGLLQHNAYHGGQIALLARAARP